jgi:monooxygenase
VREGKAKVVTGHIDTVTENGITMKGGERVDVDIIITATGLTLQPNFPMSTMEVTIDGKP